MSRRRCAAGRRAAACSLLLPRSRGEPASDSLQVARGTPRRSPCARRCRRRGGRRALRDLLLAALGPASHRRSQPRAQVASRRRSTPRRAARGRASSASRGRGASSARSSSVLDLLLGHGLPAQPDAGEEHLLVQPQPAAARPAPAGTPPPRTTAAGRRRRPRSPGAPGVGAEQRAAQHPGRLLQQRVPEVDVHEVGRGPSAARSSNVIGRARPACSRVSRPSQRGLPRGPSAGTSKTSASVSLVADLDQRRLRGERQRGVDDPPGVGRRSGAWPPCARRRCATAR